jgi:metal-responsive CopG/Arc/MetJ family transcriptional regulator
VLLDYTARGLEEALTDVQHHYKDVVSAVMQVHLSEKLSLGVLAVRGRTEEVKDLVKEWGGLEELIGIKLVTVHE